MGDREEGRALRMTEAGRAYDGRVLIQKFWNPAS